jgi:hypothetical protein
MQTTLLNLNPTSDRIWQRAALRECIQYGEHGEETETTLDGREICFNCGSSL